METRILIHFSFSLIFNLYIDSHVKINNYCRSSTIALSYHNRMNFQNWILNLRFFFLKYSFCFFSIILKPEPNQIKPRSNDSVPHLQKNIWFHYHKNHLFIVKFNSLGTRNMPKQTKIKKPTNQVDLGRFDIDNGFGFLLNRIMEVGSVMV